MPTGSICGDRDYSYAYTIVPYRKPAIGRKKLNALTVRDVQGAIEEIYNFIMRCVLYLPVLSRNGGKLACRSNLSVCLRIP